MPFSKIDQWKVKIYLWLQIAFNFAVIKSRIVNIFINLLNVFELLRLELTVEIPNSVAESAVLHAIEFIVLRFQCPVLGPAYQPSDVVKPRPELDPARHLPQLTATRGWRRTAARACQGTRVLSSNRTVACSALTHWPFQIFQIFTDIILEC